MIDWERVKDLRDEIGSANFEEIVGLFREEVEDVLDRLRRNPAPERLEEDLHFLKGSAMNLGFRALARLCKDGERLAVEGRADEVELGRLFSVYASSWQIFSEGRGRGVA